MNGNLRLVIEDAATFYGAPLRDFTVLAVQNDPYRIDTPAGHRDGQWFADQLGRLRRSTAIHLRGLHYAIVAAGDAQKPNGETYLNTADDWQWLQEKAADAARWLGYVPFDRLVDARNSEPFIHRAEAVEAVPCVSVGFDISIPDIEDLEPTPYVRGFVGRQPFHLVIFGEKTSLGDVVVPIAKRYGADVYLPSGEISDTLLYRMAADGAADGRPMRVFTLSDCDPAGHQMPISIGRKLQALRDLEFPHLQFEVRPIGLSVEQVRELGLPSTPLKATELRAAAWREAFGVEQTEIDALATLRPNLLAEIVEDALVPFFDADLDDEVLTAEAQWEAAAKRWLAEQMDEAALENLKAEAESKLEELRQRFAEINEGLRLAAGDRFTLPPIEIPEPTIDPSLYGKPLISSTWPWAEQTKALIARKRYVDGRAGR